jgi:hypothetical protein
MLSIDLRTLNQLSPKDIEWLKNIYSCGPLQCPENLKSNMSKLNSTVSSVMRQYRVFRFSMKERTIRDGDFMTFDYGRFEPNKFPGMIVISKRAQSH